MKLRSAAKWAARIIGLGSGLIFLALFIGEAIDGLYRNSGPLPYAFFVLMAIAFAGVALGWLRPEQGGGISVVSGVMILLFHFYWSNVTAAMVFGTPFLLAGMLFLLSVERNDETRLEK